MSLDAKYDQASRYLSERVSEVHPESIADLYSQASDLELLELVRAMQLVLRHGNAVVIDEDDANAVMTLRNLPDVKDRWVLAEETSKTLTVDKSGVPLDDPREFALERAREIYGDIEPDELALRLREHPDLSGMFQRPVRVVLPINLAEHRAYANAIEYRKSMAEARTEELAAEFNELPLEERKRRWEDHEVAMNEMIVIYRSGSDPDNRLPAYFPQESRPISSSFRRPALGNSPLSQRGDIGSSGWAVHSKNYRLKSH